MDWSADWTAWAEHAEHLVGRGHDLDWWQMAIRGVIVFLFGLLLVRFPGQRIFGKSTAFDIVLAVLVGSNLSRALTGNAPLAATLATTAIMVFLHWGIAHAATRWPALGGLAKGTEATLVRRGQVDWRRMHRHGLSRRDLEEAMRERGVEGLERVETATLERDGRISIVARKT